MSLEDKNTCTVVAQFLMGGPDSLGGQSRERGVNLLPCEVTRRGFQNRAFKLGLHDYGQNDNHDYFDHY